ncbi:MAG: hypothetical protein ACXAAH_15160 [Promethearchaeota archaeon]|jgi:hypothetical protein
MAVTKLTHTPELITPTNTTQIQFICPVCKAKKSLKSPRSIVDKAKGLTTMSIAKGLVCEHQFQAFVDKNFIVRGYQRVDFEFEKTKTEKKQRLKKYVKDDKELFENLILEGNYLEYKPKHKIKVKNSQKQKIKINSEDKDNTLQELYDEFWEFIDEDNKQFQEFIKYDVRRKSILLKDFL